MKIATIEMSNARSWTGGHVLDLDPGFNVLVGPSDCGKSNVVRNLRSLIENDTTGGMLSDGASEVAVTLKADDGTVVALFKRADGSLNRYNVTPAGHPERAQTFEKVGASTLQAVSDALGMGPLPGVSTSLHIGDQFDPRFCVADKPSEVARTVSAACGIDAIVRAVAAAGKDARAARQEAKAAEQEANRSRVAFEAMRKRVAGLNARERAAQVRSWENQWASWDAKASAAAAVADACQGLTAALRAAPAVEAAGRAAPALDASLGQAEALLANAEAAAFAAARFREAANAVKALTGLAAANAKGMREAETEIAYVEGLAGKCPKCGRVNL